MGSIKAFITRRLKLKVNESKSAVDRPSRRKFLGFTVVEGVKPQRRIADKSLRRFRARVRELTRRRNGVNAKQMVLNLTRYLEGWVGYFGFCETPWAMRDLDGWIRRRLRATAWRKWKRGSTRYRRLRKLGVPRDRALYTVWRFHGAWRASRTKVLSTALPATLWDQLGLVRLYRL